MKKSILTISLFCIMLISIKSQVTLDSGTGLIPTSRIPAANVNDWSKTGTIPKSGYTINFNTQTGNLIEELEKAIHQARIDMNDPMHEQMLVVQFGSGVFAFPMDINSTTVPSFDKNILLKGISACETTIEGSVTVNGNSNFSSIQLALNPNGTSVTSNPQCPGYRIFSSSYNSNFVYVDNNIDSNGSPIVVKGDFVRIENQYFYVESVSGNKITFETNIRNEFNVTIKNGKKFPGEPDCEPGTITQAPTLYFQHIEGQSFNIGIENIRFREGADVQEHFIKYSFCHNSWIKGVKTDFGDRWHIIFSDCYKNLVELSFFNQAKDHGGGGKGYGIMLTNKTSDCLILNNIFRFLRHGTVFQDYSNGNVTSDNYFTENFKHENGFDIYKTGDITFHGNNPYNNLAQRNIGEVLQIDNEDGTNGANGNGPNNTMVNNNYCRGEGLLMASDSRCCQILINNTFNDVYTLWSNNSLSTLQNSKNYFLFGNSVVSNCSTTNNAAADRYYAFIFNGDCPTIEPPVPPYNINSKICRIENGRIDQMGSVEIILNTTNLGPFEFIFNGVSKGQTKSKTFTFDNCDCQGSNTLIIKDYSDPNNIVIYNITVPNPNCMKIHSMSNGGQSDINNLVLNTTDRNKSSMEINKNLNTEKETKLSIKCYPTPTQERLKIIFTLPIKDKYNMEIIDTYGRVVKKVLEGNYNSTQEQIEVNIQDLPRGVYQCRLSSKQESVIQKIVLN